MKRRRGRRREIHFVVPDFELRDDERRFMVLERNLLPGSLEGRHDPEGDDGDAERKLTPPAGEEGRTAAQFSQTCRQGGELSLLTLDRSRGAIHPAHPPPPRLP